MLPIKWSPKARHDFDQIIDYIFERNPMASFEMEELLLQSAQNLSTMPFMGRKGRIAHTREWVAHPNYILVYRVTSECLEIIAVLHSSQSYP